MTAGFDLLADDVNGALHVAVARKGVLQDLYSDAPQTAVAWGAVYLGKVMKVDTKLDAAIVDLGSGQTGFLPAKHVRFPGSGESETRTGISSLLSAGQTVLVQVKSEGKRMSEHENQKLPRLTMKVYIPGLCLAYSPLSSQVTISRKVENKKILSMTARLKGGGGWIVRNHIETADEKDVEREAQLLQETWRGIVNMQAAQMGQPGLLMPGPDALHRALIDHGAVLFEHIYAGNKNVLDRVIGWSQKHLPALATSKRLRLFKPEQPGQRLFDIYDLYAELERLRDPRVHLDCGATLIIEPTTALTFIDVNQGSAGSIAAANQEAAKVLARQCRLRNMSGAILVDFINMTQREDRARLLDLLSEIFADDMAQAQVHGFTRLGIVELTRKRRTASYAEKHAK